MQHFQNCVPIFNSPPTDVLQFPPRWATIYSPDSSINVNIYQHVMSVPTLDEWRAVLASMLNGKAAGLSGIPYEMLKHLDPISSSLLLQLVSHCLTDANIPDLWRQALVYPIPKSHEWNCHLKNTRPITLLESIRKTLPMKSLYT